MEKKNISKKDVLKFIDDNIIEDGTKKIEYRTAFSIHDNAFVTAFFFYEKYGHLDTDALIEDEFEVAKCVVRSFSIISDITNLYGSENLTYSNDASFLKWVKDVCAKMNEKESTVR